MNRTAITLAIGIGALIMSAGGAFAVVRSAALRSPQPSSVANWPELTAAGQRSSALPTPLVTIVAFTDFQCPSCRAYARTLRDIQRRYPQNVAIVYRNLPLLARHKDAMAAALSAECAAAQGRYLEYAAALYEAQSDLSTQPFAQLARRSGVKDLASFEVCRRAPETRALVERDIAAAIEAGAVGTPTIIINGQRFGAPPTLHVLDSIVQTAVARRYGRAR